MQRLTAEQEAQAHRLLSRLIDCSDAEREQALQDPELDPAVRREVLAMLADDEASDDHDSDFGLDHVLQGTTDRKAPLPEQIGNYRIRDVLGEGGMGIVFLAEQEQPVRRRVALKLIKFGIHSETARARFQLESSALALMNHDAIAKVYEFGTTDDGHPFFAMELVDGMPLTKWCDHHNLTVRERIELFLSVCGGVQHAHQKGVVHRDLKPSNILVADGDGQGSAKIIDFGIARASEPLLDHPVHTRTEARLGTPAYMSPEQAAGKSDRIDTRTDVYSLGVVLYELLCGSLPFEEEQADAMAVMQRLQAGTDPKRPSTRITNAGDTTRTVAERRGVSMERLRRQLRTDLDWVVVKALAHDPDRRYPSAQAFAEDLKRHLNQEPVEAGPPTWAYRLNRFVARYRVQCTAALLLLLAIVSGGVATYLQSVRAQDNADRLAVKVKEFNLLVGEARAKGVLARIRTLVPAWPHRGDDLAEWQTNQVTPLLAMRPEIERTIASLERSALPRTEQEVEQDRRSHPQFETLQGLQHQLASFERAEALAAGRIQLELPELTPDQQQRPPVALQQLAWERLSPKADQRVTWGEEGLGLAYAQCAHDRERQQGEASFRSVDLLAWAWLMNGDFERAAALGEQAVEIAPAHARSSIQESQQLRQQWLEQRQAKTEQLRGQIARLQDEVEQRRTYRFTAEQGAAGYLRQTLTELVDNLDDIEDRVRPLGERRLRWSRGIASWTRNHPNAGASWDQVRAAIAASPKYPDPKPQFTPDDVLGLVPIGENPVTGLWEFYHLRSAWDGEQDPATIAVPEHKADGTFVALDDMGIAFVLLPGGTPAMGCQGNDPGATNYDPAAQASSSPVHEVNLAPFFLARTELTQGQWQRLWEGDADQSRPSSYPIGANIGRQIITERNPVENVSWQQCRRLLHDHGLELPTEAQWEYGARAGTQTPYWFPVAEIYSCENIQGAVRGQNSGGAPVDVFALHAPAASFGANDFGLHDVLGNVREWCLDPIARYGTPTRDGDGYRTIVKSRLTPTHPRTLRGGFYQFPAAKCPVWARSQLSPENKSGVVGLRPARSLRPLETPR